MIRSGLSILAHVFAMTSVLALAAGATGIDGAWVAESKVNNKKRGEMTLTTKLDLKASGEKLTGSVNTSARKKGVSAEIMEGKIDGNQFSFTTVMKTRKGDRKMHWEGTLDGNELKGTCRNEKGKRSTSFTARRAG